MKINLNSSWMTHSDRNFYWWRNFRTSNTYLRVGNLPTVSFNFSYYFKLLTNMLDKPLLKFIAILNSCVFD